MEFIETNTLVGLCIQRSDSIELAYFYCITVCLIFSCRPCSSLRGSMNCLIDALVFILQSDKLQMDEIDVLTYVKQWANVNAVSNT